MGKAELEIAAKMIGGVVFKGELYAPRPGTFNTCHGCEFRSDGAKCTAFRIHARVTMTPNENDPTCFNTIWIKQNLR